MKVTVPLLFTLLGFVVFASAQAPRTLPAPAANPPAASPAATPPPPPIPTLPPANRHRLVRELGTVADNIGSQGDFGAQLWLVADETFYQDWRKPETPSVDPQEVATPSRPLFTVIVFYGPTRDAKGQTDVTYDLVVKRPDGSVYHESKGLPGHQAAAPVDGRMLMLGRSYLKVAPGADDPLGKYVVEATVFDDLAKKSVTLKTSFTLHSDSTPTLTPMPSPS